MNRTNLITPVFALALAVAAVHGAACGDAGGASTLRRPAPSSPNGGGDGSIAPNGGTNDGTASQPNPPPAPPTNPAPPPPAAYVRGSLLPLYQLLPRAEYGRVKNRATAFSDADYEASGIATSAAAKLDEVAAIIARDRGGAAVDVIPDANDRQRAQLIPFRGKPSDVKFVHIGGQTKLYVPLGGDVMTVGDQVAVVSVGANQLQLTTQVQVGIRPQRVAVHPAGLVFVCNQYSNYISIVDPRTDALFASGSKTVDIPTEYMCSDLIFGPTTPQDSDPDRQYLYVANRWRHSVLKYEVTVAVDAQNRPANVASKLVTEILGVGNNPWRLSFSEQRDALYVANNKGGEVARVDLGSNAVTARVGINAPSVDVVNVNDLLFVPTLTIDRGLLSNDLPVPPQVSALPVTVTGLDQKPHIAHPGAMFDHTRSYNFEDLRNGMMQLDSRLAQSSNAFYYTDDVSSEPNFVAQQKVLAGSSPMAVVRNAAGTLLYLAMGGNDLVQEMKVSIGTRPNTLTPGRTFKTKRRPFALSLDEANGRLFVADWGSELVEQIDLRTGKSVAAVDTGFAQPPYPATAMERGELFYYNADWSNNGRKSCATCHADELDTDGVGYSNGATAQTAYHQVKPSHNLATTDSYFWNGAFADNNYTSLAFGAQTRVNCQIVEFGLIEGPGSDPNGRVGDPNNAFKSANDTQCRPVSAGPGLLANQAAIDGVVKAEKALAAQRIQAITGVELEELSREIDAYDVAALRLQPNPLAQMYVATKAGGAPQLDALTVAEIDHGKDLFTSAGCSGCHPGGNARHPFADGLNHGSGADWTSRFIATYQSDPRITQTIGTFPATMLDALTASHADHEVNLWLNPLDFFVPFCFSVSNCLQFDDPLQVRGGSDETRRLNLIVAVNLQDPDRGFVPGDVVGQAMVNTPSLRGVWTQPNLLHHGLAHTIREAVLAPGHPALQPGESGFAVDALGHTGVHGATQNLSVDDVRALVRYVESIE